MNHQTSEPTVTLREVIEMLALSSTVATFAIVASFAWLIIYFPKIRNHKTEPQVLAGEQTQTRGHYSRGRKQANKTPLPDEQEGLQREAQRALPNRTRRCKDPSPLHKMRVRRDWPDRRDMRDYSIESTHRDSDGQLLCQSCGSTMRQQDYDYHGPVCDDCRLIG